MSSSPANDKFMDFKTFQSIIEKNRSKNLIVQLEGGEPLLHPLLFLFIEYACSIPEVSEISIDTNGKHLTSMIDKIIEIAERTRKKISIKPSVNSFLISQDKNLIERCKYIASSCEFLEYISIVFNVRYMNEEDYNSMLQSGLSELLKIKNIKYTLFQFNKYGRAKKYDELPPIKITQIYDNWKLYSVDGKEFSGLEDRATYEEKIMSNN